MRIRTARATLAIAGAAVAGIVAAGPAAACGGLVGENGSITLVRTTTLAAWHDGIEHYVTSFEFSGEGESVGSIVPLPGVPTAVEPGGEWTLQRLRREVGADEATVRAASLEARDAEQATVILETQIDALDITILEGGGDEVGQWALDNGFFLTPDAPEVLDFYAERSPIFMAARFDAQRAAEQGLVGGQGTPVHLTIPTPQPWVPLRILGLGLPPGERVEADIFLLTDDEPELLAGGGGLDRRRSEPASDLPLDDLRSDRGMEWVPDDLWLTHLVLDEHAGDLVYDLSIGTGEVAPSPVDAGLESGVLGQIATAIGNGDGETARVAAWLVLGVGVALLGVAGGARFQANRT